MEPLKFIVSPHIVQDLGLNLYTSLPRVLVEFVANAYDADSPTGDILADKNRIDEERVKIKIALEAKKKTAKQNVDSVPEPEEETLPEDVQIIVEDQGQGMSREELRTKFLVTGRRRREVEKKSVSENGRLLMGRKGLGKLAGFGVARKVTLITRKKGDSFATKIVLDYDELLKYGSTHEIPIKEEQLAGGCVRLS
jgi:HSP90 family molecular chaperone